MCGPARHDAIELNGDHVRDLPGEVPTMTAHALYVTAAYGISALVIAALIGWIIARPARAPARTGRTRGERLRRRSDRNGSSVMTAETSRHSARGGILRAPAAAALPGAGGAVPDAASCRAATFPPMPSALIGEPAPETSLPPLRRPRPAGARDAGTLPARSRWSMSGRRGARRAARSIRCCWRWRRTSASTSPG